MFLISLNKFLFKTDQIMAKEFTILYKLHSSLLYWVPKYAIKRVLI